MADPFLAEVRMFPFNFAPKGWAFCDGQALPVSQNTALFALLGTTYGGDGKATFNLPNLMGSSPMHPGQGPGLEVVHELGETGGSQDITLLLSEIPVHTHSMKLSDAEGNSSTPAGQLPAGAPGVALYTAASSPLTMMAYQAVAPAGGGLPHENMMPYLTVNFCIALQGVFPPRG